MHVALKNCGSNNRGESDRRDGQRTRTRPGGRPASSGKGKWLTIVIAVVLVVTGAGVGAWLSQFWVHPNTSQKGAAPKQRDARTAAIPGARSAVRRQLRSRAARALPAGHRAAGVARPRATIEILKANDPVVRTTCSSCSATRSTPSSPRAMAKSNCAPSTRHGTQGDRRGGRQA